MRINRTRHFWFTNYRDFWYDRWYARKVVIGVVADPEASEGVIPYRFAVAIRFWLIPNLIWYQTYLYHERGEPVYQCRIVGVQNWPFSIVVHRPCFSSTMIRPATSLEVT